MQVTDDEGTAWTEFVHENDHVRAVIIDINVETKKISLALKASLFPEGVEEEDSEDDDEDEDDDELKGSEGDDDEDEEDEVQGVDEDESDDDVEMEVSTFPLARSHFADDSC